MRGMKMLALLIPVAMVAAGCTTLPSESEPVALRSIDEGGNDQQRSPTEDLQPDLLAREFYSASAVPTQRYSYARTYLTDEANSLWNPANELVILDSIDVSFVQSSESQRLYRIEGTKVGDVNAMGAYSAAAEPYNATLAFQEVDGQWRISRLPNEIVVDQSSFRSEYRPFGVYFFNPLGTRLVSDRRWIYAGSNREASDLASLVLGGPSEALAPGVSFDLPNNASFVGYTDGVYRFTGLTELNRDRTIRLAAQIVWTLSLAGINGPFILDFDGGYVPSPHDGEEELTVEDFIEYNPQVTSAYSYNLFAVENGEVLRRQGDGFAPAYTTSIPGIATSVAVSGSQNNSLVVSQVDDAQHLYGVTSDFQIADILTAESIAAPSYEPSGLAAWTVVDGQRVVRVAWQDDEIPARFQEVPIQAELEEGYDITALALSPSRAQVAFIHHNRLYLGTIAQPTAAEFEIVNVTPIASHLEDTVISFAWRNDNEILVGTNDQANPVCMVASDGSFMDHLPSNNIIAPVHSVAANTDSVYVTDARASLELPLNGYESSFWREVNGLEGTQATVFVAQ